MYTVGMQYTIHAGQMISAKNLDLTPKMPVGGYTKLPLELSVFMVHAMDWCHIQGVFLPRIQCFLRSELFIHSNPDQNLYIMAIFGVTTIYFEKFLQ